MDGPLLQEILAKEQILRPETILNLVEDVVEDHLLEVVLWTAPVYEIVPGNPPGRLYERDAPAVRLSSSANAIIGRVRPRIAEVTAVSVALGSFRSTAKRVPGARDASERAAPGDRRSPDVTDSPRSVKEVIDAARTNGLWALSAAQVLAGLVADGQVVLDKAPAERVPAEELSKCGRDRARARQLRQRAPRSHAPREALREGARPREGGPPGPAGIADEHLSNDRNADGLGALRESLRLQPKDLGARELLVRALRTANQVQEAAREAIALGRDLTSSSASRGARATPSTSRSRSSLARSTRSGSSPGCSRASVTRGLGPLLQRDRRARREVGRAGTRARGAAGVRLIGEKHPAIKLTLKDLTGFDEKALAAARAARESVGFLASLFGRGIGDQSLERLDRIRAVVLSPPALVLVSLMVLASTLAWGTYQLLARKAYEAAAARALVAIGAGHFEEAREAVRDFESSWARSRSGALGEALEAEIDEEESFAHGKASARACARPSGSRRRGESTSPSTAGGSPSRTPNPRSARP